MLYIANTSLAQGRGDQLFDESYIHEIRITSDLSLDQMFNLFVGELGSGAYTYTASEVEIDGNVLESIGVRIKGGLSSFDEKKPLKLDFNSFVPGQRYDGLKKLNLHQGNMDPSFIREAMTYGLMRNAGVKTARTSFAKVFFNGNYEGVYTLVEQIDDNFIKDRFASNEGALYKTGDIGLNLKYEINNPLPYEEFVAAVNQIPTELLHEQLGQYLNVESYLRFFAIEIFVNAVDGPLTVDTNYYIYYEPKSGTYYYIPWDYNLSLYGNANHTLFEESFNFLFERALSNSVLRDQYLDIYCQLLQYNFRVDRLQDLITSYQDLLKDEVPNDPYIDIIGDWNAGIETIRNVVTDRYTSLRNEVNDLQGSCPLLINPIDSLDVVINEIVASNGVNSGITDPAGGSADWIELYNNTSADLDLDGFYLSNDRDVLKHWKFPEGTTIAANDYLIIWADRDVDEEGLHVDFKLNKTWAELILSYENGDIIDEVIFSDQETNVGYARVPNGTGDFKKQETTFGASNNLSTSLVNDFQELNWDIFPNPAYSTNILTIQCSKAAKTDIQIVDMFGKLTWTSKLNLISGNNQVELPTGLIEAGVYNVILNSEKTVEVSNKRLIILE